MFSFCLSYQKLHLFHCLTDIVMCSNQSNVRMNMSLPVSPCSSPLRQYRQSNRSCLASPPHPAYSAGAANYSPINIALYPMRPSSGLTDPWLDISQLRTQTFDSPRRLQRFQKEVILCTQEGKKCSLDYLVRRTKELPPFFCFALSVCNFSHRMQSHRLCTNSEKSFSEKEKQFRWHLYMLFFHKWLDFAEDVLH